MCYLFALNVADPVCGPNEFMCNNGQCIDKAYRCDSIKDCDDKSDELNCRGVLMPDGWWYSCNFNTPVGSHTTLILIYIHIFSYKKQLNYFQGIVVLQHINNFFWIHNKEVHLHYYAKNNICNE